MSTRNKLAQSINVLQCLAIPAIVSVNPTHRKIKRRSDLKSRTGIPTIECIAALKRFFYACKIDTITMVRSCGSSGEGILVGLFSASDVITRPATILKRGEQALTKLTRLKQ